MDPISAQILGRFAPIWGSWTIACINIESMDGIWGKRGGIIVHGPTICTQGHLFCTNTASMDDSGKWTNTNTVSMDDLGAGVCADTSFMDDSHKRICTNTEPMNDSDAEDHINAEFVNHGTGGSA